MIYLCLNLPMISACDIEHKERLGSREEKQNSFIISVTYIQLRHISTFPAPLSRNAIVSLTHKF